MSTSHIGRGMPATTGQPGSANAPHVGQQQNGTVTIGPVASFPPIARAADTLMLRNYMNATPLPPPTGVTNHPSLHIPLEGNARPELARELLHAFLNEIGVSLALLPQLQVYSGVDQDGETTDLILAHKYGYSASMDNFGNANIVGKDGELQVLTRRAPNLAKKLGTLINQYRPLVTSGHWGSNSLLSDFAVSADDMPHPYQDPCTIQVDSEYDTLLRKWTLAIKPRPEGALHFKPAPQLVNENYVKIRALVFELQPPQMSVNIILSAGTQFLIFLQDAQDDEKQTRMDGQWFSVRGKKAYVTPYPHHHSIQFEANVDPIKLPSEILSKYLALYLAMNPQNSDTHHREKKFVRYLCAIKTEIEALRRNTQSRPMNAATFSTSSPFDTASQQSYSGGHPNSGVP